ELRVHGRERREAEPALFKHSRGLGFDQKVSAAHEVEQDRPPLVTTPVERDAALVAVVGPPVERAIRARLVGEERPESPRGRSPGRLDLNDVGSKVPEDLTAEKPALVGEIQYAVWRERVAHRSGRYRSSGGYCARAAPVPLALLHAPCRNMSPD